MTVTPSRLLILAAVIVWVLVACGVIVGNLGPLDEVAVGLAFYGAASLV